MAILHSLSLPVRIAIARSLRKATDAVSDLDVIEIQDLHCHNRIRDEDMTSIGCLTNLRQLDLSFRRICDIQPLQQLTWLRKLDLSETLVTDIQILSRLSQLEDLRVRGTNVSEVSSLSSLRKLTFLDLTLTLVSCVADLRSCSQLTTLKLAGTGVSNLSALQECVGLAALHVEGMKKPLPGRFPDFEVLRELHAHSTNFEGSFDFASLSTLHELGVENTSLVTIDGIEAIKALRVLRIDHNFIDDLSPLLRLPQLTHLSAKHLPPFPLEVLGDVRSLESLEIGGSWITSVQALDSLSRLRYLTLRDISVAPSVVEEFIHAHPKCVVDW